ncbi:MAG: SDR family oxidoreductase [Chloroflexi bacterium]|nr:SDR family oxidoreductase [Chloroflexota bacterium]
MSVLDRFRLDGRRALVTGGGTGIGKGLAQALAEAGADVAVCGRTQDTLERTVAEVESRGARAKAIHADVTSADDVRAAVQSVVDEWGSLDIAVNNAGITTWVDAVDMPEDDWDRVLDTNLKGVFLCSQEAARVMIPQGRGAIVNVASISAQIINRPQQQAHYSASKAGVVHLTRALAAEWAEHGVRVNAVSPGYTRTEMVNAPHMIPARPIWTRDTPMGRMAEIEEIQGAVVFLASDAAAYVTGHDLVVDGGVTAW